MWSRRRPASWQWGTLWRVLLLGIAVIAAILIYQLTATEVTVLIDGRPVAVRTHRTDVGGVVTDLNLLANPADRVEPGLDVAIRPGLQIAVHRARPVDVHVDGSFRRRYTAASTVRELLSDLDISLSPYDEVWLDDQQVTDLDAPLPAITHRASTRVMGLLHPVWQRPMEPLRVSIRRAVALEVTDGSGSYVIHTTAATVGEALHREGVTLYLGDLVRPDLGARVTAGMHVFIERSQPFTVLVDGREIHSRSRAKTVGDALGDLGIVVAGADLVQPALDAPLEANTRIRVTRVRHAVEIEQETLPFETVWVPDDDLEIDQRRIDEAGQEGLIKRRYRLVYHDGELVSRELEDEWVAQEPITRVIAYGRKIVLHTLQTPDGPITYWRKVRMLATSYSPSTAGVDRDDPHFGITRLGLPMRKGIVAVDPTVIKLGSNVYVPGYGLGQAADTGGLIRGRRIDLGYSDHDLVLWYRWVDVYLLAPPPPAYQIRWILPDWPQERRR
ncbi:MAG: hypothetical protein Kow0047_11170 [Anaerolineae bacterium]